MSSNTTSMSLEALQAAFEKMQTDNAENMNAFFLCSMALIIFLMQCGFAFLEAGAVRSKNTTNILIKNLLDSCIAVIAYWAVGWAFAYGDSKNEKVGLFIGHSQFFLKGVTNYALFFFQYVFAATAATIVSGAVAERCEFITYISYCTLISVLTHWGWSEQGWMKKGLNVGNVRATYVVSPPLHMQAFQDFAGAGLVHLCGGSISIIAAYVMGPRIGRFPDNEEEGSIEIKGHSVPFAALGGFILMFGFLAFNGGSTGNITDPGVGEVVALAMVNTILCGAFAAIAYLLLHFATRGKWTLILTINAALAGMVSACSCCNNMDPWGAIIVGSGSGITYYLLSIFVVKMRIDDPLDAFAVHAGGGFWGLFSAPWVISGGIINSIYNVITGDGGGAAVTNAFGQLGWEMICALAIIVWSALTFTPLFLFLKAIGKLRVPAEIEVKGLDIWKHGEAAYPLHAYGHGWEDYEPIRTAPSGSPKKQSVAGAPSGPGSRKISASVELSLEELAAVYAETSTEGRPQPKKSTYHNPAFYEHPEHHRNAKVKKMQPKPGSRVAQNGTN